MVSVGASCCFDLNKIKFNTPDSLMSNFETILETDEFTMTFTSCCKVFYQCGVACWYNQSESQPTVDSGPDY